MTDVSIFVTKSNIIGKAPLSLDPYGDDFEVQPTIIPTAVMKRFFSCDISFSFLGSEGLLEIQSINFPSTTSVGQTIQKISTNTIRLSGSSPNVSTDSFYEFLLPNNTIKVLPANNNQQGRLIQYSPPSSREVETTFTCNFTLLPIILGTPALETVTFSQTFSQYYVWDYSPDIESVISLTRR